MPLKASIGLFETFLLGEKKDKKEETLSTRLRVLAYFTLDWMSYFYLIFHRTLLHSINILSWILPLNHQQRESRHEMIDVQRIQ